MCCRSSTYNVLSPFRFRIEIHVTASDDSPPVRPLEPDPADCCGGGCVHCVFDLFDAALERYEAELIAWRTRHATPQVGEDKS
jgi:hypothetical protein